MKILLAFLLPLLAVLSLNLYFARARRRQNSPREIKRAEALALEHRQRKVYANPFIGPHRWGSGRPTLAWLAYEHTINAAKSDS